uniref:Uncharacterized protein n=1 Tax=Anguilla anguilla TaxID=7936 RepID=A0A0E9WHH9_ANGAN
MLVELHSASEHIFVELLFHYVLFFFYKVEWIVHPSFVFLYIFALFGQ